MSKNNVFDVVEDSFDEDVIERSYQTAVLVDFWASWCGPCRTLTPQIEAVVVERTDVLLAKVDVDACPKLAGRFQVSGIPHVKLFKDGREVAHFVGVRSSAAITTFVDDNLGPSEFEQILKEERKKDRFAEAVAAFDLGFVEQAFSHLLEKVRNDDNKEDARRFMVAAFAQSTDHDTTIARYRKQLASLIF